MPLQFSGTCILCGGTGIGTIDISEVSADHVYITHSDPRDCLEMLRAKALVDSSDYIVKVANIERAKASKYLAHVVKDTREQIGLPA